MKKRIQIGLPLLAVVIALAGSAFKLPSRQHRAYGATFLQQNNPGTANVNVGAYAPSWGWTDVTTAVDNDPLFYTDNQSNCHWSSTVTCVVAVYADTVSDVYEGVSQLF